MVHRDAVLRRHVNEHAAEPVVRDGGKEVGRDAELGAAERRRHGVAAERNRVLLGDGLLVAGRDLVGQEGHVDIGLADEQGLHLNFSSARRVMVSRTSPGDDRRAPKGPCEGSTRYADGSSSWLNLNKRSPRRSSTPPRMRSSRPT